MLSQKSIRYKFILQLVAASAVLIVVFSVLLYGYIKISLLDSMGSELFFEAEKYAKEHNINHQNFQKFAPVTLTSESGYRALFQMTRQENFKNDRHDTIFERQIVNKRELLIAYRPYDVKNFLYIKLTYDITFANAFLDKTFFSIFLVTFIMIILIVFYAFFLSRILLISIKKMTNRLANINASSLHLINTEILPEEFEPLGKSINRLIEKIRTFVKYQQEFFIGIAHELKTPLAVMKTKNEVTLLKKRDEQAYIEAMQQNIKNINDMNSMISSILEIGRQEGSQFEDAVKTDLIQFVKEKADNFKIIILGKGSSKRFITQLSPKKYNISIQPTLLTHILQNFAQNAFKFAKEGTEIIIRTRADDDGFYIEVIDEGKPIDEKKDFFAPFKRQGEQSGAGLGLFLAKNAADIMGCTITVKNRTDGVEGVISTLFIPNKQFGG